MPGQTPSSQEWRSLQGGEPIILRNPKGTLYELIHAYPSDDGSYNGPLSVVPTPAEQLQNTRNLNFQIEGSTREGVIVPAALLWESHGNPCQTRSESPYETLTPQEVKPFVERRLKSGWSRFVLEPDVPRPRLIPHENLSK
jgi:hypothetical protein